LNRSRKQRTRQRTPKASDLNRVLVAISYKTGIPYSTLLMEDDLIIQTYIDFLTEEVEAYQKASKR
jgi:hypothetical protein